MWLPKDPWLNLSGMRRLPVVRQAAVTECGIACVAMIAQYFGSGDDLVSLRRRFGVSLKGATLKSLISMCESMSLSARAVRCGLVELRQLQTPCVLHWELSHFVVLRKVGGSHLVIHDPARGLVRESFADADRKFTGVALELLPTPDFRRRKKVRLLQLRNLMVIDQGFVTSASAAMLFALVSESLLLAMPMYLQTVIDQVLMRGDHLLLSTLVLAFGSLAVFQIFAGAMRQLTFQFLSQTTVFSLLSRIMRHLLRLPVSYFRVRRLGDIQQRMQSLVKIQEFVTQSAPAMVLDAFFLVLVSIMMLVYQPVLTLVVVLIALAYALWRTLIFRTTLEQANRLVHAEAATQTHLLESLRVVQSIKMMAGERNRTVDWQHILARRINMHIRIGNLRVVDGVIHQVLFQGLHIGVVYVVAREVMIGNMSIGMTAAFVAYTGMFATRASGVINRVFEYRLLKVPLNRLADIVFHEAEPCTEEAARTNRFTGSLQARALTFAYSGDDQPVLRDCSISAASGEFIVVRGRSGSGKSTLLRLLAGLEEPSAGALYFDGRPAAAWPLHELRSWVATVFQDDALISGTVAENIALFCTEFDVERMRWAARRAVVDMDIEEMPMAYETRIGDLGSALSAGQMQRILLARALYRKPRLLLLDEFTSGLDENTERLVVASVARLRATRVVVTHSDTVTRTADRVFELSGQRLAQK
jgi:ATP-binding cassette subfamily B protein RaxB